jgi:hypothetical protein
VPLSISTDDPTISNVTLTEEWLAVTAATGLTLPELWQVNLHAPPPPSSSRAVRPSCAPGSSSGFGGPRSSQAAEAAHPRAERLAFSRKRAWTMNTAPTAMTSQSQTLKPSSIPSATVGAMIKVKAATVAQFLTRDCDLATSPVPSIDPVGDLS